MDIQEKIRTFIIETFLFGDESHAVGIDDSFYEKGIVDSTGVLNIIAFLEDRFALQVKDEEILPENFDSIGKITAYVEAKTLAKARAGA